MPTNQVPLFSLAAILLIATQTANAATVTFFGEDNAGGSLPTPNSDAAQQAFLDQLEGELIEDFEDIAPGTQFPITVTFNGDAATLTGTNVIGSTGIAAEPLAGRFAISGNQYLNLGTFDAQSFTLTFDSPQAAFGFYATDVGNVEGQLTLSFDGGPAVEVAHTITDPGAALFFGYIDRENPFTTVEFGNSAGIDDAFGFDDFTIGRVDQVTIGVIPEPTSVSLLAVGLGSVLLSRRRSERG